MARETVNIKGDVYSLYVEVVSAKKRKPKLPSGIVEKVSNVKASKLGKKNVLAVSDERAVISTALFDVMQNDLDREPVLLSLLALSVEKRDTKRLVDRVKPRTEECDRILRVLRNESK